MNRAEKRRQKKLAGKAAKVKKSMQPATAAPVVNGHGLDIEQAFQLGNQYLRAGDLPKAEAVYQQIVQADPSQPVALHTLGVIAHQLGKNEAAVELIRQALAIQPDYAEAHNNLGGVLNKLGYLEEASACYQKALGIMPDYAAAHFNLGNAFRKQGELTQSVSCYRSASTLQPEYAEAYINLGSVLLEQGNIDDAIAAFQKALIINPNYAEVHYNMGNALLQGRRLDDAFESYNKAISVRPNYAEAYSNLGNVLKEMRKPDAAIASYQKALEIMPDFAEACGNLGNTLLSANRPSEAIVYLTKAHALEPNEKHAYLLNSLQGVTSENAPREYIEDLFDSYAERFEEHLVGKLEYGIPKLLKETLADLNLLSTVVSTTVDMGCGTGLLGTEFRPKTKNLIGIDLSEKMIAQARSKQLYDTLIVDDLVSGLAGIGAKIDLFLAADVFVYVGKLHATFEAVKAVAARGAHFAFSLEEHDGAEPFYLQKSARYAHSKTYIEALAEEFGFNVLHFQRTQIRKDKQNWINGFIYVLQNSDSGL